MIASRRVPELTTAKHSADSQMTEVIFRWCARVQPNTTLRFVPLEQT